MRGDGALQRLLRVIQRKHEAGLAEKRLRYAAELSLRVAAGTALDGLRFLGSERQGGAEELLFACPRNDSRLRPGSRLLLSRGDPSRPAARVELVDDRVENGGCVLRLALLAREDGSAWSGDGWVLDEDHVDLRGIELSILDLSAEAGLESWLEGGDRPSAPEGAMGQGGLDEAFDRASLDGPWDAFQGPPGTGKTHLLARVALDAALNKGRRVLVTAVSHQAIGNALSQCYWHAAERSDEAARALRREGFFKIGSSRVAMAALPADIRSARRLPKAPGPWIAGATLYALFAGVEESSQLPLADLALFDEAGQAPLVLGLGARLAARRAVFIGDDRQLPPVHALSSEEEREEAASESVLQMVRARYGPPFFLSQTRRMNAELCRAVSDCFYGGGLSSVESAASRRLPLRGPPRPPFDGILAAEHSLVFLDVREKASRSFSDSQARWAAAAAAEAVRCGIAPREIGFISPFRAQCNRIRRHLQEIGVAHEEMLVSTVERFQGQEREMIVLSWASSDASYLARTRGFLFSAQRLNVAVSRARTKVLFIGALEPLEEFARSADPDDPAAEGARAFLRLLSHARVFRGLEPA